ncbi:MAG: MltA domain-containing protein [Paracoccaceae bacterium]|nr:MltA domain-containing protein [Paracoccaceae bacterium]
MMRNGLAALLTLAVLTAGSSASWAEPRRTILSFADLQGWAQDDHAKALEAFRITCGDMAGPDWRAVCGLAKTGPDARQFFELFFRPVLIEDGAKMLFTAYFEPELKGSRTRTERYKYPVYRKPPELTEGEIWHTRKDIESGSVMSGRGLEIAWVDDPAALTFMQVQGSGRIRLTDGTVIRLGYAASNGRKYRSIGKTMVSRGIYNPHQVSAKVISNWVRRNPARGQQILWTNPSYVFFRVLRNAGAEPGPRGAMNRPLTPRRSLAVDRDFMPLGAPVWIEKSGANPMRRLMVAQDTGSAIRGAQRADIFMGTGDAAGYAASHIRDGGRMIVLMPIEMAFATAWDPAR